jgi:PAS domain S-box-containing protein
MTGPKRILHLEDSPEDAELIAALLDQEGLGDGLLWVTTRLAFQKALEEPWDLILADYALPGIRDRQALDLALERCPDTPFIYISGTIGEVTAIECLHHGAVDYILKQGLNRLVPAVRRALADGAERRARRQAEAALVASEANYRRIVETSFEGIWIFDAEARTTFANPRMAEMLAVPMEELQGASLWEFLLHEDRAAAEAIRDDQFLVAGIREIRFRRRGGTAGWALISTTPSYSGDGHYTGAMLMATDITSLKTAEAARDRLEAEQRELLAATSTAGVVPWSRDPKDGSFLMGSGAEAVVGWPPEHFRKPGYALASLVHPEDWPACLQALAKADAGEICTLDLRVVVAVAKPLWTRWTFSTTGGRLHGAVRDVNEPHQLLDMLLQSQKLESMGAIAGGVAHDVNNLLMVFLIHMDLIRAKGLATDELADHFTAMVQAADQVKVLVGDLLSFARKKEPRRVQVDLNELVLEARGLLTAVLGSSVILQTALEPGLPFLLLDGGQIHQVLMNLVINARDAMAEGGTIRISTWTGPESLVLEVLDTGQGIPPDLVPRIFEPFFTTKPEGKGTGLGLAVVYGIVTAHGGTVQCVSTPGEGTRFRMTFPVAVG